MENGGTLSSGLNTNTGAFTSNNLVLNSTSNFVWDFKDPFTTVGSDYDRVTVNGTVTLDGTLSAIGLTPLTAPLGASQFIIIDNDSTDAITGTFAGLAEGANVDSPQGYRFTISYVGGTGNDVVLNYVGRVPGVADDAYNVVEETPFVATAINGVRVNDPSIYPGVTFQVVTPPAHGILSAIAADGSFTYTPNANYVGVDTFTYKAIDVSLTSSPTNATVTLTISNVQDTPDIVSDGGGNSAIFNVNEGAITVTTVQATDGDIPTPGDTITYSIFNDPLTDFDDFTIDPVTGTLSFLAAGGIDFETPTDGGLDNVYELVVRATDGNATMPSRSSRLQLQIKTMHPSLRIPIHW